MLYTYSCFLVHVYMCIYHNTVLLHVGRVLKQKGITLKSNYLLVIVRVSDEK